MLKIGVRSTDMSESIIG